MNRPWYELYSKVRNAGVTGLVIMGLYAGAEFTDFALLDQITADEGALASAIQFAVMFFAGWLTKEDEA